MCAGDCVVLCVGSLAPGLVNEMINDSINQWRVSEGKELRHGNYKPYRFSQFPPR